MKFKKTNIYVAIGISAFALGGCQNSNVKIGELENEVQAKDAELAKQQQQNIQLQKKS